jgi:hypothetical protein
MRDLISYWRSFKPDRPPTYGQSLQYGREQAYYVRALADDNNLAIDVQWLFEQSAVPVEQVPSYMLSENSGLTTDQPDGKLRIFINANEPYVRQRFSILHEWKHAIDYYNQQFLYARIGRNEDDRHDRIEAIANDFAAHVLMPTSLVTQVWFDTRDIAAAASAFNVSYEAMRTRLEALGLIKRPTGRWRKTTFTHDTHPFFIACAA